MEQIFKNEFAKFQSQMMSMVEGKLNEKVDSIILQIQQLQKSVEFLNGMYEDVKKDNEKMKQEMKDIQKQDECYRKEMEVLKSTSKTAIIKVNEMDNHLRQNNIELHGVPGSANENVERVALGILKAVDSTLTERDIEGIRRLKRVNTADGEVRVKNPILIKFKSKEKRNIVFRERRKLANIDFKKINVNTSAVFINDNLTPFSKAFFL